jgi:class 3 adenylate cyclase
MQPSDSSTNASRDQPAEPGARSGFWDLLDRRWELARQPGQAAAVQLRELDAEIRARFERHAAPLVLDIAGFTRLTAEWGVIHYLSLIRRMVTLCQPVVEEYGGTVVKCEADNLFAHFPAVDPAVRSAMSIQSRLDRSNFETPEEFDIHVSLGIGYGPLLIADHDMWGHEFNLASKLGEDIAGSREILLTAGAHAALPAGAFRFEQFPVTLGGISFDVYRLTRS